MWPQSPLESPDFSLAHKHLDFFWTMLHNLNYFWAQYVTICVLFGHLYYMYSERQNVLTQHLSSCFWFCNDNWFSQSEVSVTFDWLVLVNSLNWTWNLTHKDKTVQFEQISIQGSMDNPKPSIHVERGNTLYTDLKNEKPQI